MVLLEDKDVWSSKCVDFFSPRKTASLGVYGSDFGLVSLWYVLYMLCKVRMKEKVDESVENGM